MNPQLMIHVRPPLAAVIDLLNRAHLPTEDLTEAHCEHFYFAGTPRELTGLVGLELYGEVALLRSLVVSKENRGQGAGGVLLSYAEAQARESGVQRVYLLTTTAEEFFAAHGYARTERNAAPPAIRATREFAGICPSSSAFMMRQL